MYIIVHYRISKFPWFKVPRAMQDFLASTVVFEATWDSRFQTAASVIGLRAWIFGYGIPNKDQGLGLGVMFKGLGFGLRALGFRVQGSRFNFSR